MSNSILKEKEMAKLKQPKMNKLTFTNNLLENETQIIFRGNGNWSSTCFDRPRIHKMENMPCHLREDRWMARLIQFKLLKKKKFVPYSSILKFVKNSEFYKEQRHAYELRIVKCQIEFMNKCKDIYGRAFYFPDKDIFGKKKKGKITEHWDSWKTVEDVSKEQYDKEMKEIYYPTKPRLPEHNKTTIVEYFPYRNIFRNSIAGAIKVTYHTNKKSDPVLNWNWEAQECYNLHGIDSIDADINFRNVAVNMLTMIGINEEVVNECLEKYSELWREKYMDIAFDKELTFKVNKNEKMIPLGTLHKMWKNVRLYEYYQNNKEYINKYGKVSKEMLIPKEEYATMKNMVDEQTKLRKLNKKIEEKSDCFSKCLAD